MFNPVKITHQGKGSKSEMLPHRSALAQLTGGDTYQRSLSNYAKKTPGMVTPEDQGSL